MNEAFRLSAGAGRMGPRVEMVQPDAWAAVGNASRAVSGGQDRDEKVTPEQKIERILSENANGAARSNPRGVLKTRGDQPTRYWLCDRRPRADFSCRPSVPSNWRARTPMLRRGGNS